MSKAAAVRLPDAAGPDSGTYAVVLEAVGDIRVRVGALGERALGRGCYVYVGSAMRGMRSRIGRHLRRRKKHHWHADYLTTHPGITVRGVWVLQSGQRQECVIAARLAKQWKVVEGFGASDCKCAGHLFYAGRYLRETLAGAGMTEAALG